MSAEIVVRRSSAFAKTTARQVDRRYNKFKRLLAAAGYRGYRNIIRANLCTGNTGPRGLCSIRATLTHANLRAARRSYSCRTK
jgi:hypothetical protein